MLLAGDIGGTKTILALFQEDSPREPMVETRFPSSRYDSLDTIVEEFVERHATMLSEQPIRAAAFGVAGPVLGGKAKITNLTWAIDEAVLASIMHLPHEKVSLLNDLEAISTSIPNLRQDDLHVLNSGLPEAGASIAVIAPGTGLGEGYLTWDGKRYRAHPSEGGHAGFSPENRDELELLGFMFEEHHHVSTERLCSGIGIPNIYQFLKTRKGFSEPAELTRALAAAEDPTPVIINNAQGDNASEICRETLNMFVSVLGSECGDMALVLMAKGGVYLGGGIPPRILPALQGERFRKAFRNKGRFSSLMASIPVYVILNSRAGLLGAAYAGMDML